MCQNSKTLANAASLTSPDSSENVNSLFISDFRFRKTSIQIFLELGKHIAISVFTCGVGSWNLLGNVFVWLVETSSNSTVIGLSAAETPHPFCQDKQDRLHKQALFHCISYRWRCCAELFWRQKIIVVFRVVQIWHVCLQVASGCKPYIHQ